MGVVVGVLDCGCWAVPALGQAFTLPVTRQNLFFPPPFLSRGCYPGYWPPARNRNVWASPPPQFSLYDIFLT